MNIQFRKYKESDENDVIKLWQECGLVVPWNDPHRDIERMLKIKSGTLIIGEINDEVIATAMVGYDGHRGWIYYLAVKPKYQKHGVGRLLMEKAERNLLKLGCPKINIMVRKSNLDVINFYESIGYKMEGITTLGKRLIPDN